MGRIGPGATPLEGSGCDLRTVSQWLGFNDAFKKSFDGALLAERVRRLIPQKEADQF